MKKTKQFLPGHIVRYTGTFLRNIGMQAGGPINGRVESLMPGFRMGPAGGAPWPYVLWSDADEPKLVNPVNVELDPRAKQINDRVSAGSSIGHCAFGAIQAPYSGIRVVDQGSEVRVTISADGVSEFADQWPASGLHSVRGMGFAFEKRNGDLVDIWGEPEDADGGAVSALADDLWNYAVDKLRLNPSKKRGG